MANKRVKKQDNGIIAQAKVANKVALSVGEELVDFGLKGANTSQKVFDKVVKGGVTIFGMQQQMVLDTLESIVTNEQLQKMVKLPVGYFNKFMNVAEDKVEELREDTVEVLDDVKKVIAKKPAAKKTTKKVATKKRATAKKIVAKKVTKTTVAKDDITKIKGIGPKVAEVFTKAGFGSFKAIATANKTELEKVLESAGARYARLNPTPWIKEAKKLAK